MPNIRTGPTPRLSWPPIIARAAEIVESYDIPVTLRQLFYRLVAEELIRNSLGCYSYLSELTAKLRRRGEFPQLSDRGRRILRPISFRDPADALEWLSTAYRVERAATQPVSLWLGVEKNALAGLLQDWFEDLGLPILPLGGYSSQSLDGDVREEVARDARKAVLIYAGDFDASGMDIGRSFIAHTDCWAETIRIGLSEEQIAEHALPVLRGKAKDARAAKFIAAHPVIHAQYDFGFEKGKRVPVQVELDALDPDLLHGLFTEVIERFWDVTEYAAAVAREELDREELGNLR